MDPHINHLPEVNKEHPIPSQPQEKRGEPIGAATAAIKEASSSAEPTRLLGMDQAKNPLLEQLTRIPDLFKG